MKYLLAIIFLISIAFVIKDKRDKLTLSDSSQTLYSGQKIQLANSSFGSIYLHVFKYEEKGPLKHVNLTDELKGVVMRIESFELLEEEGISVWLAFLKQHNDDNTYVCEIEEALKTKEIILQK